MATTKKTQTPAPRIAADGTTELVIGMKVRSEKDGMTGVVHALDRSDLYVKVKRDDTGKVIARSTKTLAVVKTRATKKAAQ